MERMSFNYSTKNIPVASPKDYTKHMIDKTEQLLRRMRWKAFHFLNPELTTVKENFGFKTRNCPPVIEEMKKFEDGMISIIQNINFQDVKCQFQQDLKEDIKSVKNDKHLFVKADKSINFHKLDTSKYNQLLNDNVTKTYKKTDKKQLYKIDAAAKKIAMKLNIDDRVEITATKEAFITLKDHKDNFENRPTCRLINPSKPEIGRVSKQILEKINRQLVDITKVNQWKNTASMLQWYKQITNKRDSSFICFDVVEFYPSISEVLLNRALDFASKYVTISADDRQIIIHAKRSLLFNNGDQWGKKTSNMLFDITMGSYDGAETCELVGCYLLSKLKQISGNDIGLYRDDGLAILNKTPKEIEKMKKEICKVFADNDLRITIEANKKVVNFLDVTLDLNTEKYKPYAKPTNIPLYVHSKSNHPPNIIKNIPESINRRLSDISSDEDVFNEAAPVYQEALRKSGYTHKLEYKPKTPTPTPKRNRHRNLDIETLTVVSLRFQIACTTDTWQECLYWPYERHVTVKICSDASDYAWGGVIVVPGDSPVEIRDYWDAESRNLPIAIREALALLYTLLASQSVIRNARVDAHTDNMTFLQSWKKLGGKNRQLNAILKRLYSATLENNVHLTLQYIPSHANPADPPSHQTSDLDCTLSPEIWATVEEHFGPHTIDLMSLDSNAQRDASGQPLKHYTPFFTPLSSGINVFAQLIKWDENVYVFPPFVLVGPLLKFLSKCEASFTIVVPKLYPLPFWWPILRSRCRSSLKLGNVGGMYKNKLGKMNYSLLKDIFVLPFSSTAINHINSQGKLQPGLNWDVIDKAIEEYNDGPVSECCNEARTLRFLEPRIAEDGQLELVGSSWSPSVKDWPLKVAVPRRNKHFDEPDDFSALKRLIS
ncbi:hypothetical protein QZH41_000415 [Actinostola sp. cb2023]|nr:hypothetical protein QZH41_000415 [Actinostola sp. cb2023]